MSMMFDDIPQAPEQPSGLPNFDAMPDQSAPRAPTVGSVAGQTGLGVGEGLLDLENSVDPFARVERGVANVVNPALKAIGTDYQLPTMEDVNRKILGSIGADPGQYPAQNTPEKIARFAGSMIPGFAIPGGEARVAAAGAKAAVPEVGALLSAARAAYRSPEVASLKLAPEAMEDLGTQISNKLMGDDIHPLLAPKTYGIVDQMTAVPEGTPFVTAANVQTLRRVLGKAAASADPTERLAARTAQGAVDDFMADVGKSPHVMGGDADAAAAQLQDARGNYAAAMRTQRLDDAADKAARQAARAGMGGNWENATRQRVDSILNTPSKSRGLSDAEKSALSDYVEGNFTRNALRAATKILGGDNPLMASIHSGLALGAALPTGGASLAGLVAPLTGYALKKLNDIISARQLGRLGELLRSRSPLAQQMQGSLETWAKAQMANDPGRLMAASRTLAGRLRGAGMSAEPGALATPLQLPGSAAADPDQKNVPGPPGQQHDGGAIKRAQGGRAQKHSLPLKGRFDPASIGARRAKDGNWYIFKPHAQGNYMKVVPRARSDLQPVDYDSFAPQGALASQVAGFPQRAASLGMAALGPLGEAGMTVGDWLRTGGSSFDTRDIAPVAAGVMLGTAAPEADEGATAAAIIKDAEPEMVAAFNEALPSIKEQYMRWAGANHSYQELTPDDAAAIYGEDDIPDELRQILDTHGRAVEIGSDNREPEYFAPTDAPTREQHMQEVVENEGGLTPVNSLDEAYNTLSKTRGFDPIFANSQALNVLAKRLGWYPTNGVKYFSLTKDGYPGLNVRVSDHPNLTRTNPNATTPDINLAPGAHDFHDAASIMMEQEPETEGAAPGPGNQQHDGGAIKRAQGGRAQKHSLPLKGRFDPASIGARRAKDGNWYIFKPHAQGNYMKVVPRAR